MKPTITATTLMAGLLCACAASAQPPARATAVAVNSANQLDGGNISSYIDGSQTRSLEISGQRMTIRKNYEESGCMVRAERVLKRVQQR